MQDGKTMTYMMKDLTQYVMLPKIRYAAEIGTYASYDIAAYDFFSHDITEIVWDVTADRELALHLVNTFNRVQLEPSRLKAAIIAMLP